MKRLVLGLIMAGGLAMMSAAPAGAVVAECGKTYAILVTGAQASTTNADGSAGFPGALTHAVGVGSITFGPLTGTGCTVMSGEFIYNSGDVQSSPMGYIAAPAHCYDSVSATGTGIPCFDGGNHMIAGSIGPDANDGNSLSLTFTTLEQWVDTSITPFPLALNFDVQNNTGGTIVVGSSVASPGADILTLTMQKIGATTNSTPAVPTAFGAAPYVGDVSISCESHGANTSDFVAGIQDGPPAVAGGYTSVVGALEIFNPAQAGGSLTFNGNDDFGATTTPTGANDCSFSDLPGNECSLAIPGCSPQPVAYGFADGTSNSIAFVTNTGNDCGLANTAGAGYATSAVVWGTTFGSSYLTTTGLVSASSGFVPPGGSGTCTTYASAPAGKLTAITSPASQTVTGPSFPQTKTSAVKLTSTTPADCDVSANLIQASGPASECMASLTGTNPTDVNGGTIVLYPGVGGIGVSCTCTSKSVAETDTYTLSFSSTACPIASGSPITFTCKN